MLSQLTEPQFSIKFLSAIFLAILFLQSGIDKLVDWKGNLEWLTGHFANSPLGGMVPIMLGTITLVELAAGVLSGIGSVTLFLNNDPAFALLGAQVSALSIVMLFFGQRIAKDYAGAATLAGYFILCMFAIYMYI